MTVTQEQVERARWMPVMAENVRAEVAEFMAEWAADNEGQFTAAEMAEAVMDEFRGWDVDEAEVTAMAEDAAE